MYIYDWIKLAPKCINKNSFSSLYLIILVSTLTYMVQKNIIELYRQGYDCAQCVCMQFINEIDCDKETAMKLISAMGMGLLKGSICGAIIGALAIIGLKYGNSSPDMANKGMTIIKRSQFFMEFEKLYSGLTCPELMKLDVRNDEENLKAYSEGVYEHFCPKLGADVVNILNKILN